jgi:hypothetical protein
LFKDHIFITFGEAASFGKDPVYTLYTPLKLSYYML